MQITVDASIAILVADYIGAYGYTRDQAVSAAAWMHCVPLATAQEAAKKFRRTILTLAPFEGDAK